MKKNLGLVVATLAPVMAFAEEAAVAGAKPNAAYYSAAAIMAIAVAVGTFSQSRAAVSALDGISRNPAGAGKALVPLILSLALIESLVLFAFVVANGF
ncbi:MAG TPA: ATP synthase F0 subunit C [Bdellovibrionota bacterium]|jgi:F-type H+-transporting ATPase subunit c|nr:ATP synthase F0 subunit C [Bdellovibrionota bacterium]